MPALVCGAVVIFLHDRFRSTSKTPESTPLPSGPFGGGPNELRSWKSWHSPTYVNRLGFQKGDSPSKNWSFDPPLGGLQATFPAVTASDIRLDRRFAFRFDARAPKWDLNGPRTVVILTFVFVSFFTSGGEFSYVPSENANSPRAWPPLGAQSGLKTLEGLKKYKLVNAVAATGTFFGKAAVAAMALRISYFFMKNVTLVKEFGHSGPNLLLKSLTPTAATGMVWKLSLCGCIQRSVFCFFLHPSSENQSRKSEGKFPCFFNDFLQVMTP